MKTIYGLLLLIYSVSLNAADIKYPVSTIKEELKKDVNAVIREDKMIYQIVAINQAKVYTRYAVTIFNSKGNDFAEKVLLYDKLRKISSIDVAIYDATGNLIKKLKKNEIRDQSAYDGSTLYSDNRYKIIDASQSVYPYTVEFEYEVIYNYLYQIDGTVIVPDENVSVENASYQLIFPVSLKPRFKTFNINFEPQKAVTPEGLESLTWNFKDVLPIKFERLQPDNSFTPKIVVAPGNFEYSGFKGEMSDWKAYGKWFAALNNGKDMLPGKTRVKVKELTSGQTTNEAKIKALYEYLQSKTRYVNIALGIGDLQPFDATVVDNNGYGDCKALSNYMVALLKEAGIKGYYATVMAGSDAPDVVVDFPSHQANHAIVAVPNGKDTVWLECTSQTNPFGYMGRFTGDRKAMLITDHGGVLVNTPRYTAEQNLQSRVGDVYLENSGDAKAKIKTTYAGLQYETDNLDGLLNNQYDEQRKWLQSNTQIPTFDIDNFTVANHKSIIPYADVSVNYTLRKYATVSGKRLFITPNLMNRNTYLPQNIESRKTSVVWKFTYTDVDTIRFHIPANIYPEALPEAVNIKNQFGEYQSSITVDAQGLTYVRKIKMNKGEYPASSYQELVNFFRSVTKADNTKMVFLNKT
jgi:hypothetical protein